MANKSLKYDLSCPLELELDSLSTSAGDVALGVIIDGVGVGGGVIST